MTNLFNIDIEKIRYDGANIQLIKLGGTIIYEYELPPLKLYVPEEFMLNTEITKVRTMVDESHDNLSSMFLSCTNLVSVNTEDWDTSNVTDMSWMFCHCSSLQRLYVRNFDTSKVTDMNWMFTGCSSLTSLDLSNWNTSNVTNMQNMFSGCSSLTSLDLSNWNTSNVIKMAGMFHNCSSLISLDLSNFDTSKVYNMAQMFEGCTSLTSLDLSNFDTSKVYDTSGIVLNTCTSLHTLYLNNCNNETLNNFINEYFLPKNDIGQTRTIYCKKSEMLNLLDEVEAIEAIGWTFHYVDEE